MRNLKTISFEILKYTSIALAITLSTFVLGWSLKIQAQRKLERPKTAHQIAPQIESDKAKVNEMIFLAETAQINGKGEAKLEQFKGEKDIGWWDFKSQSLSWDFPAVTKPGLYQLEVRYSRASLKPCTFNLKIGSAQHKITLPGTGGWGSWKTLKLTILKLKPQKAARISLHVLELPQKGVINFVHLKLTLVTK